MRSLLAIAIAAILGAVAGWLMQQLVLLLDPSAGYIARNCLGAAVFAGVLLGCLVVIELQAREG
jgi:fluoride ion exporter CrcB/FEX